MVLTSGGEPPARLGWLVMVVACLLAASCGSGSDGAGVAGVKESTTRAGISPSTGTSTSPPAPTSTATPTTTGSPSSVPVTGTPKTVPCSAGQSLPLTTRQKVSQVVLAELTYAEADQAVRLIRDEGVGGIIFLGSPSSGVGEDLARIRAVAKGRVGPFLATDEEGGRVQRLASVLGAIPSAREMAATMTPEQVADLAREHAKGLRQVGIDLDLAPVVDVNATPTDGGVIGDRSFGTQPAVVAAYGLAFERGLGEGGVVGTVKHFPGHGRASGDSHAGPVTTPPLEQLQQVDLLPFEAAAQARVPAMMIGHLTVPGLTNGQPATFSPEAIKGLLRGQLGYDGLVVTDSVEMGAITSMGLEPYEVVERTLTAGADLALLPGAIDVGALLDRLAADAGTDKLPTEDLDRAVRHVAAAKSLVGDWPPASCP